MNLPHAIRAARVLRNMSQREVAERAGVHASLISQIERGHDGYSVATLDAIARALDLSVPQLVLMSSTPWDWAAGPGYMNDAAADGISAARRFLLAAMFSNTDATIPPAAGDEDEMLGLENLDQ